MSQLNHHGGKSEMIFMKVRDLRNKGSTNIIIIRNSYHTLYKGKIYLEKINKK